MAKNRVMRTKLPSKVEAMYHAVLDLILEGNDISKIKVSDITGKAGIGKGTAYEYFNSREEIIGNALIYYRQSWMREIQKRIENRESFVEQMDYIFQLINQNSNGEKKLFFAQVLYVMHDADKSDELRQIKHIIRKQESCESVADTHMDFISQMIVTAQKNGEVTTDYPLEYIQCEINGRVLGYLMYCMRVKNGDTCSCDEMRRLLVDSIEREFCLEKR